MSLKAISTALSTHLSQMPNLPPVAWENGPTFKPPANDIYLAEFTLPAGVNGEDMTGNGATSYGGIYQVTVFAPSRTNKFNAKDIAGQIAAYFNRGLKLEKDGVRVEILRSYDSKPQQDADWYSIPLTISYNAIV